jgi:Domain of unknown function (DUF4160)
VPTVLQVQGFRVRILLPPREHPPPHVHVAKGDGEVVILLPGPEGVVAIRTVYHMRTADVVAAVRLVEAHVEQLQAAWRKYHG